MAEPTRPITEPITERHVQVDSRVESTLEGPQVPSLAEVFLDYPDAEVMLELLNAHITPLQVRIHGEKGSATSQISDLLPSLAAGAIDGAQIHYEFDGVEWLDTLVPSGDGVRVVRVALKER